MGIQTDAPSNISVDIAQWYRNDECAIFLINTCDGKISTSMEVLEVLSSTSAQVLAPTLVRRVLFSYKLRYLLALICACFTPSFKSDIKSLTGATRNSLFQLFVAYSCEPCRHRQDSEVLLKEWRLFNPL